MKFVMLAFIIGAVFLKTNIVIAESITQATIEIKPKIINYGVLKKDNTQGSFSIEGQETPYYFSTEYTVVEVTDEIEILPNLSFGLQWAFSGLKQQLAVVEIIVTHPNLTDPSGRSTNQVRKQLTLPVINGVVSSSLGYLLDEPYKRVPGEWVIEVRCQGASLSKAFILK